MFLNFDFRLVDDNKFWKKVYTKQSKQRNSWRRKSIYYFQLARFNGIMDNNIALLLKKTANAPVHSTISSIAHQ